jgi:hypothetical protein
MFTLIVVFWLGQSSHTLTMHDFTTEANCKAAAQKVIELTNQHRRANDQMVIAESCVQK